MYRGITQALGDSTARYSGNEWTLEMPGLIHSVSWSSYEAFLQSLGDYRLRHTYYHGELEVMPRDAQGEWLKCIIRRIVQRATEELRLPIQSVGSMTLWSDVSQCAIQPDESFYLANEPRVRGREEFDPETDPPPDLVVEVDLTSSSVDRMPVYATLRVPELWRYSGTKLTFYGLARGGKYRAMRHRKAFEFLRPADLTRFLDMRHDTDENSVIRAFVQWLRDEHGKLVSKKPRKR